MSAPAVDRVCRRCGCGPLRPRYRGPGSLTNRGRGLCAPCYLWAEQNGQLSRYPRATRPWVDTAAEGERLYAEHFPDWTWRDVAAHMGISFWTLDQARRQVGRSAVRRTPPRPPVKRKAAHTPQSDLVDRGEL